MLMIVSILLSSRTASVALSRSATGACCLMLEKVPAWREPNSDSTDLMREVLFASEEPVMMKALEFSFGRHSSKWLATQSEP